jgi:hypothetical protein
MEGTEATDERQRLELEHVVARRIARSVCVRTRDLVWHLFERRQSML